jgi:hypothetical protein
MWVYRFLRVEVRECEDRGQCQTSVRSIEFCILWIFCYLSQMSNEPVSYRLQQTYKLCTGVSMVAHLSAKRASRDRIRLLLNPRQILSNSTWVATWDGTVPSASLGGGGGVAEAHKIREART